MRAVVVGGLTAAAVLVEAGHVGPVNGLALLLAFGAALSGFVAARWYRRASADTDRLVAGALHPNRQADRDARIIRVANAAQVQL